MDYKHTPCLLAFAVIISALLPTPPNAFAQKRVQKKEEDAKESVGPPAENGGQVIRDFDDFITPETYIDHGLFTLYRKDGEYFYGLPDSLLGRDMLMVSRIVRLPQGFGGGYVNAGSKTREQIVRWEKHEKKILLRKLSYNNIAPDSVPIYFSVEANNYAPIVYAFDIHATGRDSASFIFKVNAFFEKDVKAISGLSEDNRQAYKIGGVDAARSFIRHIHAYPSNIEVQHELTYHADKPPSNVYLGSITMLMNQSMVLLPDEPMRPRLHDPRVGWFTVKKIDYGSDALKSDEVEFIRRWRLEPADPEAYARGVLVDPVKPIVYYIDPATPEKWRPYFRRGVELWQKVFETAGFKNAIIVKDPPTAAQDPEFSPEDVRYSVIRYVASTTRNAMGPSVVDPRSGEIIESDIIWYHNHLRSYRNRFLIETGGANPAARTLDTPLAEIGEMMTMVIAHEVGHALGLPHNMKASSAYPVDSLRSPDFTKRHGIAATIMDYARFNYVAQPGDGPVRFVRQIGPYDHYVINWGYRVIPQAANYSDEKPLLSSWIVEKAGDPVYRFGSGYSGADPSAQTEDVGNDPVRASAYALENLRRVAGNLLAWTTGAGDDYDDLKELYGELIAAWGRYAGHVITNIGGVYHTRMHHGTPGTPYQPVDVETQKQSLQFVLEHVLDDHDWLLRPDILTRIGMETGVQKIRSFQKRQLDRLLDIDRLGRLEEQELQNGAAPYGLHAYMDDLREGIWRDAVQSGEIDIHKRNLQRSYLDILENLIHRAFHTAPATSSGAAVQAETSSSEIGPAALRQATMLLRQLTPVMREYPAGAQRAHVQYAARRLETMLAVDN